MGCGTVGNGVNFNVMQFMVCITLLHKLCDSIIMAKAENCGKNLLS